MHLAGSELAKTLRDCFRASRTQVKWEGVLSEWSVVAHPGIQRDGQKPDNKFGGALLNKSHSFDERG